jgi:hypothetical protein
VLISAPWEFSLNDVVTRQTLNAGEWESDILIELVLLQDLMTLKSVGTVTRTEILSIMKFRLHLDHNKLPSLRVHPCVMKLVVLEFLFQQTALC